MHAWLFRNRARLRLILGLGDAPPQAAGGAIPVPGRARRRAAGARRTAREPSPGEIARLGSQVVVVPMPRGRA